MPFTPETLGLTRYVPRIRTPLSAVSSLLRYQEVDVLGIVVGVGDVEEVHSGFKVIQRCSIFLLDETGKMAIVQSELAQGSVFTSIFKVDTMQPSDDPPILPH